jgi:hypothetical protein
MARYVDTTRQLVVELSVRDLGRSLAFYQALGFQVPSQETAFSVVAWDDHQLFLSQDGLLTEPLAAPIINAALPARTSALLAADNGSYGARRRAVCGAMNLG